MIAGRTLWLTADGMRLVEDGDPEADPGRLFCTPGMEIHPEQVERFAEELERVDVEAGSSAEAKGRKADRGRTG